MNIEEYLQNHGIRPVGTENEHVSDGWIGIDCPFCGETGQYHLGISVSGGGCRCWRCGKHKLTEVLKELNISLKDFFANVDLGKPKVKVPKAEAVKWPTGCSSGMWLSHKRWIKRRGFRPKPLQEAWRLRSVGPTGKWKWRIVIPVFYNDEAVSWTTRDVTGNADIPYISAPKNWERRDIKDCIGGGHLAEHFTSCIVVEGPVDAWRIGPGAVYTFGSAWTTAQAQLLAKNWRRIYVMYDWTDDDAMKLARDLASTLELVGTDSEVIQPTGTDAEDPGELKPSEVKEIRRELGFEIR